MDRLEFCTLRGRGVAPVWLACALLNACAADPKPGLSQSNESSEAEDDDDDDNTKETPKADAKVSDAGGRKDAGTSAAANDAKMPSNPAKDSGIAASGVGLPCDVAKIVSEKCGLCHGAEPSAGAPMSLVAQADFHAAGSSNSAKKVYQLTKERINASTKASVQRRCPARKRRGDDRPARGG